MINRAELTPENRIVKELAAIRRDIEQMKSRQLLGGDNIVVTATAPASVAIGSLAAGDTAWISSTVTPANGTLTLWDFRFSVYVDGGSPYNYVELLPVGSSLPAATSKLIRISYIPDWASSIDSTGIRKYYVGITNNDSVPHTISFQATAYAIKTPTV